MKKIILSLVVLCLTVAPSFANINLNKINLVMDCLDRIDITVTQAYNAGYTDDEVLQIANIQLAICMGYSYSEVMEAQ